VSEGIPERRLGGGHLLAHAVAHAIPRAHGRCPTAQDAIDPRLQPEVDYWNTLSPPVRSLGPESVRTQTSAAHDQPHPGAPDPSESIRGHTLPWPEAVTTSPPDVGLAFGLHPVDDMKPIVPVTVK